MTQVPRAIWCVFTTYAATVALAVAAYGQGFTVGQVASGLDSPTYVTQAPGDNNTLYITELGGAIKQLDLTTGVISPFTTMDAATHWSGGLHTMAFHPDFQTNGKFYVTRSLDPYGSFTKFVNRLDEFMVDGGGSVSHSRMLLEAQHSSSSNASHAIDWVGFDPTDPNSDTVYASIGDGFINNSRPPGSPFGKILAFDTSEADPNWQLHHSGLRNPWRASFDRQNGDMYIGDVGLSSVEEINFAKAGTSGLDFGWADCEGACPDPNGPQGDALNPIHQVPRPEFNSIVGGYVYRGPVTELEGQYFFADTVRDEIWSGTFDRDTDPNSFNGANLTGLTDRTAEINSLIPGGDPNNPIDNIVSFGEDNAGNLYFVDLGDDFIPTPGSGAVYVIRVKTPGDFDCDGDVDGEDFLLWQQGGSPNPLSASDLADWEANYGAATLSASSTAVPEPSSLILAILAQAGLFSCSRRSSLRKTLGVTATKS